MSKHARTEPISDNRHLLATVTSRCFSQTLVLANGWPRLVIDHGGTALVLDIADLWHAERSRSTWHAHRSSSPATAAALMSGT